MTLPRLKRTALVAGLLACALTACTAMRWDKPGLDPVMLDADLGECRGIAHMAASRYAWFPSWPMYIGRDRAGRPVYSHPLWDQPDRFFLEQDLYHSCMRRKGYGLVPAEPR